MKKILSYSGILFVALTMTLGACKKKEDPAPSNPTTKSGIFTCKVNGNVWESNAASTLVPFGDTTMPSISAEIVGDTLSIIAFRTKSGDSSMLLFSATLKSTRLGTYNMSGSDNNIFYINSIDPLAMFAILFGYTATSSLTITKWDATNKKMSGTFSSTMTPTSGGTTFTITDGSFIDVSFVD